MTVNEIDKILGYITADRVHDLHTYLMEQRTAIILANSRLDIKERKITQKINAVKRYLGETNQNVRPALGMIHHTKENEPFICNGYTLIKWNSAANTDFLGRFDQLSPQESLNSETVLAWCKSTNAQCLTEEDKLVIQNIGKFIKLYKSKRGKEMIFVRLFGACFDACLILETLSIIGRNILDVKVQKGLDGLVLSAVVRTQEQIALILSIRNNENEKLEKRMAEFFTLMKQQKAA